ncbi:MAG TPA: hypothetical protein VG982_00465 [Candidatus Paceibacterota bacterium]|nr:hypothetical protein [Candidatus Paceibacterota bacterium]
MNISEAMDQLTEEGGYVFHGSGANIVEFEPRQAHTIIDGKKVPDGEPAVFASTYLDYAIFMALFNKENCPKGYRSGVSYNGKSFTYTATQETLDQVTERTKGKIYVFKRSDFIRRNNTEWVSTKNIKPILTFEVTRSDFKPGIQVITE